MQLKNKKILVTGANGFLGKHLVENLINKRGVSRENLFTPSFQELDLTKRENCEKAVAGQDIVIHLAGKVGGIGFNKSNMGGVFYDNAAMALNLIEASRVEGIEKFVGIGSVCAYPKFIPIPFKEKDLWNGYPEETNASYGLAKKFMLVQSQAYREEYGVNYIHLLMVNLYGPGDNFDLESSHVIPALIRKIAEAKKENKEYIEVWGTGEATREFLFVEDAAEGIILATENYDKSEPVNLGSGMEISIKDLVNLISEIMEFKGQIRWDKTKPDGQPKRMLDVSKAEKEFGFRAKVDFREGLKKTIDWYLANRGL